MRTTRPSTRGHLLRGDLLRGPGARRASRAAGALLALALAAGLGGCAGEPGAAAVVDGRTIRTSDLQHVGTELGPLLGDATSTQLLAVLVQEPIVTRLAQEHGVGVSEDEAREALVAALAQANAPVPELSDASLSIGRYLAAVNALQASPDAADVPAELAAAVAEQDLEVNPRFGTVDEGNAVVPPTALPWIAVAGGDADPAGGTTDDGTTDDGTTDDGTGAGDAGDGAGSTDGSGTDPAPEPSVSGG